MGVYIRGMEFPKTCAACEWSRYSFPNAWCCRTHKTTDIEIAKNGRPDDCPLVPVPPHGRLIDADAMLMRINHEVMEAYMDGACYGAHPSSEHLYLLGEIIDDAPTIIPTDEPKEETC